MDRVFELFPRLQERRSQKAGTMSGGEQQMCAIGRALMARPKLLLLDEPSLGLAPIFVERIFEIIKQINEQGTSILLVEQNALMALDVAQPRLRARDGPHRARRQRRGAEDERAGPQDVPRRDLGVDGSRRPTAQPVQNAAGARGRSPTPRRCEHEHGGRRRTSRASVVDHATRREVLGRRDVDQLARAAERCDRDQRGARRSRSTRSARRRRCAS